jgi:hypothetical protein
MAEAVATLALLVALAAFVLAYRAHKFAKQAHDTTAVVFHIIESRASRTVICDLTDGRVTVIKELKDAG